MMKKYSLFFIFLFFSGYSLCQIKTITLKDEEIVLKDFNFFIDSIIDAREEKNCIGYEKSSKDDAGTAIFLNNDLRKEFMFLLEPYLYYDLEKTPLLIKVNKLFLFSFASIENYQGVEINITFLIKKNNEYYELATLGTTNYAGIDKKEIISVALQKLINEFQERIIAGKIDSVLIGENIIGENRINKIVYKASKEKRYKRGIYWSFTDFRDCTPDTVTPFKLRIVEKEGLIKRVKVNLMDSINDVNNAWGFCDGRNNFVNLEYDILPLEKSGDSFHVKLNLPASNFNIMFGVLAFGIAIGYNTDSRKSEKLDYILDLNTARFNLPQNATMEKIEAKNIFCFSKFSKAKKPIEIIYKNKTLCTLNPSTYFEFTTTSKDKSIDITIKYDTISFTKTLNPKLFHTHFYDIDVKEKRGKIIVEELYLEMKKLMLTYISNGKIKQLCE